MKKISNDFINLSRKVKTQDLKLSIKEGETEVQEVHLMPVNIFNAITISELRGRKQVIAKELIYSFEGQLFKTIMQQIEITVKNAREIKGKNVDFQYGILVNKDFEYLNMGEYYIKDVEDDKNKEELVVTGYDKMLNFMIPFKQSELKLTYPCKMKQLVNRMGEVCGVKLYSTDFYNSDLIVDEDFFTIQELTYRDVLEKIAQATLTTIFIKENKLYLCKIGDSVQTLDTSFLSNLVVGEKFGPVNALILGRGSVEDNIEALDQESINANGRCEIRFDENEFVDSNREQVIDGMLQQINGLEYYSIEASNLGVLWLDPCDVIIAKDREESEYKTIYLKAKVTINTGIKGEMGADIPESTTTEYKVTTKEEKKTLKVERLAKKNEGFIQDIIEENKETSSKLSKHEQTIDGITEQISNIQQFSKKLTGTNQLSISNAEKFQILEFIANGQTREFEYIYPSGDLYPSEDLYPQGVYSKLTLVIDTQKRTRISENAKKIEIDIGEPLYSLDDICDKLKIEVKEDKATCTVKVIRNLKYENGAISKLENEVETILSKDLDVGLFEGENYIYLLEYPEWQIEVTYMYKSDLNKYLATKVEMNAKITKKADEINIEVKKKVDESEFGTLIEQNIEAIKIAWNQISQYLKLEGLNGQVSFNIYDNNDNLLMSLDSNGQRFYKDSSLVGHIGTNQLAEDNSKKSLDFDLNVDGNSMIWASKKSSSDKYYYWKWAYTKGGISTAQDEGIYAGANIFLLGYELQINDYLKFNGGNGLVIGDNNQFYFNLDNGSIWFDTDGSINCTNIYADNISSDGRLKENIKESIISALEIIKEIEVRSFDWKKDKRHIKAGFIAQEMEKIDENFVLKSPIKDSDGNIVDNKYYINELPIIATLTKGIQEQQKEIEELKYIVEKQEIYIKKILQKLNIEEVIEDVTVFKEKQRNTKFKTIQYEKPIKENPKFKEGKPIQIKMLKENGFIKLIKEEVKKTNYKKSSLF